MFDKNKNNIQNMEFFKMTIWKLCSFGNSIFFFWNIDSQKLKNISFPVPCYFICAHCLHLCHLFCCALLLFVCCCTKKTCGWKTIQVIDFLYVENHEIMLVQAYHQTRSEHIRSDQTRPDETRTNQTRPE